MTKIPRGGGGVLQPAFSYYCVCTWVTGCVSMTMGIFAGEMLLLSRLKSHPNSLISKFHGSESAATV